MPWTLNWWPAHRGDALDTDFVINEVRSALAERNGLVPAGYVPHAFDRWDPLRGTPAGRTIAPFQTMANFQYEIQQMLLLAWPLRWWDPSREDLYTLAHLCQDAFGGSEWTYDLTATGGQGDPLHRWTPPYAVLFNELYAAINRLDRLRILPTLSESVRHDSVYRLTFGIEDWPADRAATFALFDGDDDGQTVGLAYDVGMGAELFDDGMSQQWFLESRQFRATFATAGFQGYGVEHAWLDFTTAAPSGAADFSDTFTAEVVDGDGTVLGSFASSSLGPKRIEVPAASVHTDVDTSFTIRSTRADSADRSAWIPGGPDYTSTYREGLAVSGPIRLIAEVDLEYHG